MRYLFRFVLGVLLFSTCLLVQLEAAGQKKDFKSHLRHFEYLGLIHTLSFSPNGRYQVLISENRYHGGSEFALMLVVTRNEGRNRFVEYCLTPRYLEVVAAPHGNISYVHFNPSNDYAIALLRIDEMRVSHRMATSDVAVEQLQFSKDGQHFCYFIPFKPHPFQSTMIKREENLARLFRPAGWMIYQTNGTLEQKKDRIIFSEKEKKAFTEWAPIEKPKVIPQLLTQPMPKITLEAQVRWAPDGNYIYVWDETGIWRVAPYPTLFPMWTKIVNAPRISNLQISSIGKHLLYEVRPDLLTRSDEKNKGDPFGLRNEIWLVDIETVIEPTRPTIEETIAATGDVWKLDITKELQPRIIANGWGAAFNPSGRAVNYVNEKGFFLLDFETLKNDKMFSTVRRLYYKKSILD